MVNYKSKNEQRTSNDHVSSSEFRNKVEELVSRTGIEIKK